MGVWPEGGMKVKLGGRILGLISRRAGSAAVWKAGHVPQGLGSRMIRDKVLGVLGHGGGVRLTKGQQ